MKIYFKIFIFYFLSLVIAKDDIPAGAFSITRLHYSGGGDWYSDPSSLPNLLEFVKENTNLVIDTIEKRAKIGEDDFYSSSHIYLTGHGNIKFSDNEAQLLRDYLIGGGFLHADDNYGMDQSFRREMKKVFPELDWIEIPKEHEIFNIVFSMPNGLPKIHEHDNKRPQAFGLFYKKELVSIYTYESDLGDGWEDPEVHNNPKDVRLSALQMGTNIIVYGLLR
jgi:hypothetical protein